jgi:hypothetical protein
MSAFICGPDHFKALCIFAVARGSFGRRVDPRYIGAGALDARPLAHHRQADDVTLANVYADTLYRALA